MVKFSLIIFVVLLIPRTAPAANGDIDELKEQMADMQKRLEQLEHKPGMAPSDLRAYWDNGLRFKSTDEKFKLKIGGRIMNDWVWATEDDDIKANVGQQEDGTEFRRARMYMAGSIYENIGYKLQFDFAGGDADLKDAYIALTDFPLGGLKMGHFKEPFSLEELTSSKYITFMERALPNVLSPGRNTGFMLSDAPAGQRMTWALGLFRSTDGNGEDDTGDDGGYNITGRVTSLPVYENQGRHLLHLGGSYSLRYPDEDDFEYETEPEAHLLDDFLETGNLSADRADLLGLEAAWVAGPFSLQGEYMYNDVTSRQGGLSDVSFDGYYVQASYFLTGEQRKYKTSAGAFSRVKPKENFSFAGGPGAWEAGLRFSEVDMSDEDVTAGKLENITAGINWHLNPNMRIMWNYVHADKDDIGEADIGMMRFQIDF